MAYHNSSLPHEIRQLVEEAAKNDELAVIASTTTLAEGIDLPFRCTILVDWLQWNGDKQKPISALLFKNIAGRCGRAGVFTEGDTIVLDNPLGDLTYTRSHVRRSRQAEVFLNEQMPPLQSSLADMAGLPDNTERYSILASQFLAAIPENPNVDDLATRFANLTFAVARDENTSHQIEALLNTAATSLLDEQLGALATINSPLRLTTFGEAARKTSFSPNSCRAVRSFLARFNDLNAETLLSEFCIVALAELGSLPEQTNYNLRKTIASSTSRFCIKPADFGLVISSWLEGKPQEQIFALLPYTQRSKKTPKVNDWITGTTGLSSWDDDFDKFVDFITTVLEGFLPWLLWSCEYLLDDSLEAHSGVNWALWSEMMEKGVDTQWAVEALNSGAPGGRFVIADIGRRWPSECRSSSDTLGINALSENYCVSLVEDIFNAARREAGEKDTETKANLTRLQRWMWSKSKLTWLDFMEGE